MLKLDSIPPLTLDQLATAHFVGLNPSRLDGGGQLIADPKGIAFLLQQAVKDHSGNERKFFQFLIGRGGSRLKKILIGFPDELEEVRYEYELKFPDLAFKEKNGEDKLVWNALGKAVNKIFNYTAYRNSTLCTNHLAGLGLKDAMPCPFCNLDNISLVEHTTPEAKIQALLDLDHFFPHYRYPFLGVSLFNLIPTCRNCNEVYKKQKPFVMDTHVQPYHLDFDDLFEFSLKVPYVFKQPAHDLQITCKSKGVFPKNSVDDLRIIERYQGHRNQLVAFLEYFYTRPVNNYHQVFEMDYNSERKAVFKMAGLPFDRADIVNHSLGKLKRDICIAAGLYF